MTDSKEPDHIGEVIAEDDAKIKGSGGTPLGSVVIVEGKSATILMAGGAGFGAPVGSALASGHAMDSEGRTIALVSAGSMAGVSLVRASDYDELRQQLSDLTIDRNQLLNDPNNVFKKMADIALAQRNALQLRLKASEARNAELRTVLSDWLPELVFSYSDNHQGVIDVKAALAQSAPAKDKPWAEWAVGDTVRYVGAGDFQHDRMMIGSDYLVHEAPDEEETFVVLDDDGDELCVLVGEFEFVAPATDEQGAGS